MDDCSLIDSHCHLVFRNFNDDIDETEEKLKTIINAERLRLSQQPGIVEFIRGLNNEFGAR